MIQFSMPLLKSFMSRYFPSSKVMTRHKFAKCLTIILFSFLFGELLGYEVDYFTKKSLWGVEIGIIIFAFSYLFLYILWDYVENLKKVRVNFSFNLDDKLKTHILLAWIYWAIIYVFGMAFYYFIFKNLNYSDSYVYGFSKDMIYYGIFMIIPISLYHLSCRVIESNYDEKSISEFENIRTGLIGASIAIFVLALQLEVNYFNFNEFLNLPISMQQLAQSHVIVRDSSIVIVFFLIYLQYLFVSHGWRELVIIKLFDSEITKIEINLNSIPDLTTDQDMLNFAVKQYKKGNPQIFQNTPVYSQYLKEMMHFDEALSDKLIEFYETIQTIHRNENFNFVSGINANIFQIKAFFENVKKAREQVPELKKLLKNEWID